MEFFETLFSARAMRRYSDEPISEDILVKLIEAAHAGPSGSNRQSRHWIVVRDPEQKQRLADLNRRFVSRYLEANRDAANPHVTIEKRQRFLAAVEYQMEHLHEVPAIVIACADMVVTPQGTFGEGVQAATEVWGAVQNLLLAARALGVGSVPHDARAGRPRRRPRSAQPARPHPPDGADPARLANRQLRPDPAASAGGSAALGPL